MFKCTECVASFATVRELQLHISANHKLADIKVFRCKQIDCSRDFSSWKSFKKHLLKVHECDTRFATLAKQDAEFSSLPKRIEKSSNDPDIEVSKSSCDASDSAEQGSSRLSAEADDCDELLFSNVEKKMHRTVFMFCAKLYAVPDLPRSAVQETIDNTKELIDEMISIIRPELYRVRENTDEQVDYIDKIFTASTAPFRSFSSEYRRLKKFKESGLITPRRYIVGASVDDKYVDGKTVKEPCSVYAQYIPLRETLHCFFSLPGVLHSVLNNMNNLMNNTGIISNFVQGQLWREKAKNCFNGKTVIPLFIYYDDFDVNNLLGSHSGIQKLGGVYCIVPCLPAEFNSTIENIFMVLLFNASDRKSFGKESIFQILVDELNYLQSTGITFDIDGEQRTIYFALGLVTGDNLGLNSAFDFVESFRGSHFCRLCNIAGKDANIDLIEKVQNLRDPSNYETDVEKGETESGVKKRSIWNDVNHFHIYINFYVDPLHDLAEGALKYGMGHVLHHYVFDAKKRIPLDLVNDRMRTFNYTINNITNKPPLIRWKEAKDKRLSMSASEITNFVYIFPFLVGDSIVTDEVWRFFTFLRNILFIVVAKKIQPECSVLLDYYVKEHHALYQHLFKDNLKAKHHNMVYYGRVMRMSGPLFNLTTIRNESKNRQFKQSANATYSRRNITYTLALKETFKLGYRQLCHRGLVSKFDSGPGNLIENLAELEYYCLLNSDFRANCIEVSWVKFKAIMYRVGTCLAMYLDLRDIPVFGVIDNILINETGKVNFGCKVYTTIAFDERFDAWEILRTDRLEFRDPDSLLTPFACILHRIGSGQEFVTVKHVL